MMAREEVRLRILELALTHGLSTDKLSVAEEFAEFVYDNEPGRIRVFGSGRAQTAKLKAYKSEAVRGVSKKRR